MGPLNYTIKWLTDLHEVPRVVPKSVMADGPVGLFRNQIMIAAPSGPTQMIKVLIQRKVVHRPPLGPQAVPKHDKWPRRAISEPIMTCGLVRPYPYTYSVFTPLGLS